MTGGCLCGAIRYEATAEPTHPTICHCQTCRRAAGAPMVAWITFARDGFRVTRGTLATHRSSPTVTRGFCSACGSCLSYERDDLPAEIDVTAASLDDAEQTPPADHTWDEERLSWTNQLDALPRFPRSRESS